MSNDVIIANASSCGGCSITAGPETLTYPSPVSEVTSSVTATVIPFIYQFDNGTEVTRYSTYHQYTASASGQSAFTTPQSTSLTWTTLGTTLTYPTTYLAFISPRAGVSTQLTGTNSICSASLTPISLQASDYAHLIFPSSLPADHDIITASASSYIDTIPSVGAAVSPYKPAACSQFIGPPQVPASSGTFTAPLKTSLASENPVVHTTVAFLVQTGKPVITRVSAESQIPGTTAGDKPTPAPISNGSGGKTTTPPASNGGSGNIVTKTSPVLNVGGSTITAGPSGAFVVGGQTVTPGGSAVVVGGTTLSIAAGGSVAVVNGQTSTLSSTTYTGAQATGGASKVWASGLALGAVGFLGLLL
jgi:hypothetical protein